MKGGNGANSLEFCLLHADYVTENRGGSEIPVIRMWGKTREGKSVLVRDTRFTPYFYVQHKDNLNETEIRMLKNRIMELEVEGKRPVKVEQTHRNCLGKPVRLLKVFISLPMDVPKFRDLLKEWRDVENEYEYSISFYKRYMIDKGLAPMGWVKSAGKPVKDSSVVSDIVFEAEDVSPVRDAPHDSAAQEMDAYPPLRILAFDIETIEEKGEERIIMASFMDNGGYKKVISLGKGGSGVEAAKSEEDLIKKFVETVQKRDPDIVVGYNTDNFDFPKLAEKAEKYRIQMVLGRDGTHFVFSRRGRISSAQLKGRIHIDLYDFVSHILSGGLSSEVLTLDKVSHELLGEGKERLGGRKRNAPPSWEDITKTWKKGDAAALGKYCLKDSELALKLAENLLPQIFEIARVTGQTVFDCTRMTYSQLVEWVLIRKAFSAGELVPNQPKYAEISSRRKAEPYTGGYVHQPKEGIHENIALFDFASLYPSITITHNVSPETLDCKDCKAGERHEVPDSRHYFCAKRKGFVPMMLEELVEKRKEIKARMKGLGPRKREYRMLHGRQHALKIIANASYGYYGYAGSRWYSRICAESITAWGRMYIKKVIGMASGMGYEVIYGDTDSLFVRIKTRKEAKEFLKKVNSGLPGVMELDFRDIYESGLFVLGKTTGVAAKKRYALIDRDGNIIIRGFEKVRRDWSEIAKSTQESVLKAILKDKSPKKAAQIVRRIVENLRNGKVEAQDLVIYTQLTKPLAEYEQIGPHVVAARKMAKSGADVHEGSTIAYVISKGTGSISERAEPAGSPESRDYDPDYYINNQVIPAAMRVLSGLGYREEDLLGKKKLEQVSLSDFVKR